MGGFTTPAITLFLFFGSVSGFAAQPPIAISPGSADGALTESRCPTFSWTAFADAPGYELVVYRVNPENTAEPLLHKILPAGAGSWTPSLGGCLDRGNRYAWSIRTVDPDTAIEWPEPPFYEVASGYLGWSRMHAFEVAESTSDLDLDEALEIVSRYLEQSEHRDAIRRTPVYGYGAEVGAGSDQVRTKPKALGGSDFSVDSNGNVMAESFAGVGAVSAYGNIRYDGVIGTGAYNIASVTWNATYDRYEINLTDIYYSIDDVTVVTISGSSSSCPAGVLGRQSSVGGKLLVYLVDKDGNGAQCSFRFVTFTGP